MTASRRTILTGLASALAGAVPALGAVAATTGVDPVFAAIHRHRAVCAEFERHHDDDAERDAALNSECEAALEDLTDIVPATGAGLRALVEHLEDYTRTSGGYELGDTEAYHMAFPAIVTACKALFPAGVA